MTSLHDGLAQLEDVRAMCGVMLFLDARDLCRLSAVDCHRTGCDFSDHAWCQLCEITWRSKSARFRLTPERTRLLALNSKTGSATWREHYERAWEDGRRKHLFPEEMTDLRWAFNFTVAAGGRGSATIQFVQFQTDAPGSSAGRLIMAGYPPLPYELSQDGKVLDIANFPPHFVKRLDTWEWEITNDNVTLVSCVDDDVQYSDRGFLNVTIDDVLEQTGDMLTRMDAEQLLQNEGGVPSRIVLLRLLHTVMRNQGRDTQAEDGEEEQSEEQAEETSPTGGYPNADNR